MNEALVKARLIRERVMQEEGRPASEVLNQSNAMAPKDEGQETAASAQAPPPPVVIKSFRLPRGMGMWSLSRGIYLRARAEQRVPSLRWFYLNGIIQVCEGGVRKRALQK